MYDLFYYFQWKAMNICNFYGIVSTIQVVLIGSIANNKIKSFFFFFIDIIATLIHFYQLGFRHVRYTVITNRVVLEKCFHVKIEMHLNFV